MILGGMMQVWSETAAFFLPGHPEGLPTASLIRKRMHFDHAGQHGACGIFIKLSVHFGCPMVPCLLT